LQAVDRIERATAEMGMPRTVQASFQGTAQAFQSSLVTEPYLIAVSIFAVYIVLGALYESLIHPVTILMSLPPAGRREPAKRRVRARAQPEMT
jgi:multidrug efflux pump subunit AcrB